MCHMERRRFCGQQRALPEYQSASADTEDTVAQTKDAVEKLAFDWDRASKRDQKCYPQSAIAHDASNRDVLPCGVLRVPQAEFFKQHPRFMQRADVAIQI